MRCLKFILLNTITALVIYLIYCGTAKKEYNMQVVNIENRYLHFSLDDVNSCMQKLRNTDCKTIFEDSTLRVLKEWHKKYGIVASLYVMGDFTINSHYAKELIENSQWLKWGYHGTTASSRKEDMNIFYKQVMDSVGNDIIIDKCPRIHYFHANHSSCMRLKELGCIGFLTCDDWSFNAEKRGSNYYLTKEQSTTLEAHDRMLDTENNIYFIKTDFRLEHIKERFGNVANLIKYYNSKRENELIVFSHEWNFTNYLKECDSIFNYIHTIGGNFSFPMLN